MLWRYSVREVSRLALAIIHLDPTIAKADPFVRTDLLFRALRLEVEAEGKLLSKAPAKVMAFVWKSYRPDDWRRDIIEIFGTPEIPDSHPCFSAYDSVRSGRVRLRNAESVVESMDEIFTVIHRDKEALVDLLDQAFASSEAIRVETVGYHMSRLMRFLTDIQPFLSGAPRDLIQCHSRLATLLGVFRLICEAESGGWTAEFPLKGSTSNPYHVDGGVIRHSLRSLFHKAPEPRKRDVLAHLANFKPEPDDWQLFQDRFDAGDPNALSLMIRLWPGEQSLALIDRSLEMGLTSSVEELVILEPEKRGSIRLSPKGQQVSSAIFNARGRIPDERVVGLFIDYLRSSKVDEFRRNVVRELTEIGGSRVGLALAEAALTTEGMLLSMVAEAIEKVPTPEGLDALSSRLLDRSLRLDRMPMIDALVTHRPDERLRASILVLIQEPGCRCGGCVWRRALRKMAEAWPDDQSRMIIEDRLRSEPGYEGRVGAARILISSWPDQRSVELVLEYSRLPVSGAGEGEFGHLLFDGRTDLSELAQSEMTARYSDKLFYALTNEINDLLNPEEDGSTRAKGGIDTISRKLAEQVANRWNTSRFLGNGG